MTKITQSVIYTLVAMLPLAAWGQTDPAPVQQSASPGFRLPTAGGNLSYALNASESVSTGFYGQGDPAASTNVSGDVAYLSQSRTHPFSAIYSGAFLSGIANQPNTVVQNLALSQVYLHRLWEFTLTDSVSYLPMSPAAGLSGIAGLGDQGVDPVESGPVTGQGALTGYAPRVTNGTTLSVVKKFDGKTSLQGSGSFELQRFTDDTPGLIDNNEALGSLGLKHTLNARSSIGATYTLSKITYSPDTFSSAFNVQGVNFNYSRQLTRGISMDASLGPQWIKIDLAQEHTSLNLATDVGLRYQTRKTLASTSYVRGANSGFGVIPGAFSDSVNNSLHHTFNRTWSGSATLNYTRTTQPAGLTLPVYSLQTLVAGIQASRAVNRSVSAYVSYNAQHQSTGGIANTSGAFQGLFQVVAFGFTYSPRPVSFGAH